MSEKQDEMVVRGVRFDRGLWAELDEISAHTGIKGADLHRLALSRLVEHVRETGHLPIPPMPVEAGRGEAGRVKGDAA